MRELPSPAPCNSPQAAALLCGREAFLFGGDDDFRAPKAVLSVPPSAFAWPGAPLVAAWSSSDHADDLPWLALGCGATVRVVDAQVRT